MTQLIRLLSQHHNDRFIKEVLVVIFVVIAFHNVLNQQFMVDKAYPQNMAIKRTVLDIPNSGEPQGVDDFWTWLQATVDHVWEDKWYNDDPFSWDERGYSHRFLRLVGAMDVRQVPISADSCTSRRFIHQSKKHNLWNGTHWISE